MAHLSVPHARLDRTDGYKWFVFAGSDSARVFAGPTAVCGGGVSSDGPVTQ